MAKTAKRDDTAAERAVIATAIERLQDEVGADYRVADHARLDWCPCCGVNIRFYDERGKPFAKLICTPDIAEGLGGALLILAREMRRLAGTPGARALLSAQLEATVHEIKSAERG